MKIGNTVLDILFALAVVAVAYVLWQKYGGGNAPSFPAGPVAPGIPDSPLQTSSPAPLPGPFDEGLLVMEWLQAGWNSLISKMLPLAQQDGQQSPQPSSADAENYLQGDSMGYDTATSDLLNYINGGGQ